MNKSIFVQSLIEHRLVDEADADRLVREANGKDFDIAVKLFDSLELPSDRMLLGKLYGDSIGKAHIELNKTLYQPAALATLVPEMAQKLQCIPVYILGKALTVAMPHPEDPAAIATVSQITGCAISGVFAFPQEITSALDVQYRSREGLEQLSDQISQYPELKEELTLQQLRRLASASEVVDLVRGLLLYGLKQDASDIHIQPTARTLDVRFRIDGRLQTLLQLNKSLEPPVISRLKIMANCDIAEKRRPQDGRLSLDLVLGRSRDYRFSVVPSVYGEKIVLRAIGDATESRTTPLDQLAFSKRNLGFLKQIIARPNGVLYVTGPTGSGKTTTLYSILSHLHQPDVNIITVEDPVELKIDGVTQIQTNAAIDLDFPKVLRAVLRQDPEILLVGEVRDLETAKIASQAALTGHLVMTTLHTNSALQAITRLIDIGVDAYLVAPSVIGVLGQRLVRRICEHCKESYEPSNAELEALFINRGDARPRLYRGRGCEHCHHTGYAKRIAIHEVLFLSDQLRDMFARRAPMLEIQQEASRQGFRTMRYDGIMKALRGLTTIEEVDRVALD